MNVGVPESESRFDFFSARPRGRRGALFGLLRRPLDRLRCLRLAGPFLRRGRGRRLLLRRLPGDGGGGGRQRDLLGGKAAG